MITPTRRWRYIAPNVVTALSVVFGALAMVAMHEGRFIDAGWWIIYAVCSDRIDGLLARALRGTSELGRHFDSLADFFNFGIAPAFLIFSALGRSTNFITGTGRFMLLGGCIVWILGAALRLARFNSNSLDNPRGIFFGVPTTLAAGTLVIWFLALAKYSEPGGLFASSLNSGELRVFGTVATSESAWRYLPLALFAGGLLMVSNLRMPKLGRSASMIFYVFVLCNVTLGYSLCLARVYPEILALQPTSWLLVFLIWGQFSPRAKALEAAKWFSEARDSQIPLPEDELFAEGDAFAEDEHIAGSMDDRASQYK